MNSTQKRNSTQDSPQSSMQNSMQGALEHRHLLLVDDDQDFRDILEDVFGDLGFDVSVAASGEQGVRMVEQLHPNLVFLDQRMPGLPGCEVARIIRDADPTLPIVLMSAATELPLLVHDLKVEVLKKPFDVFSLKNLLERIGFPMVV